MVELANAASYDSIVNCIVTAPVVTVATNTVAGIYAAQLKGARNVIKGNTISNGASGIYFAGTGSGAGLTPDHVIEGNTVSGAWQYGIYAANYPLIPEDFQREELPAQIRNIRSKLFGFTIHPERLHEIRSERKPESVYASLGNCEYEVQSAEKLMRRAGIPYLDATSKSVEELATTILQAAKLVRRLY